MNAMKLIATLLLFAVLYQEGSADHVATHLRAGHRAEVASGRGSLGLRRRVLSSVRATPEETIDMSVKPSPEGELAETRVGHHAEVPNPVSVTHEETPDKIARPSLEERARESAAPALPRSTERDREKQETNARKEPDKGASPSPEEKLSVNASSSPAEKFDMMRAGQSAEVVASHSGGHRSLLQTLSMGLRLRPQVGDETLDRSATPSFDKESNPTPPQLTNASSEKNEASVEKQHSSLPRPTDGGKPDFVEFFMLCKKFYGAEITKGTFTMDLVLSYTWSDPRVADLVPHGQQFVNLPVNIGLDKMWSPQLTITSKDFAGVEVLTDFLQASTSGNVIRVTRILYTGRNSYDVSKFPFDSQNLSVLITSGNAMMDEVKLRPKPNSSHLGVVPTALEDKPFVLDSTDQWEFEEVSGPLRKSRGRFDMKIRRKSMAPLRALFYPQLLLMLQAYTAFYLPLAAFAVMPRVFTGLISFLALMGLQSGQAATVPPTGDASFMGLLNGTMMQLVTATVILNVFIHFAAFVWKDEGFAQEINDECRTSFALCSVIAFILVAVGSFGEFLGFLSFTTQIGIWVYNIGFMWFYARRRAEKLLEQERQQQAEK